MTFSALKAMHKWLRNLHIENCSTKTRRQTWLLLKKNKNHFKTVWIQWFLSRFLYSLTLWRLGFANSFSVYSSAFQFRSESITRWKLFKKVIMFKLHTINGIDKHHNSSTLVIFFVCFLPKGIFREAIFIMGSKCALSHSFSFNKISDLLFLTWPHIKQWLNVVCIT